MKQPRTSFFTSHKMKVVHVVVHPSSPTNCVFSGRIRALPIKRAMRAMLELPGTERMEEGWLVEA
jgi:hypothetical protein